MSEDYRRALLHLASSVNHLVSAIERIKPEAIKPGATLLGGTFEGDLKECRRALGEMLAELGVRNRHE